jgi:hypothetical protein
MDQMSLIGIKSVEVIAKTKDSNNTWIYIQSNNINSERRTLERRKHRCKNRRTTKR